MNILINDDTLKIGDLGESRFLSETDYLKGKTVGTPMFLSPEVLKHENYDHRVDVWALG
jgi:NIMA (never in mitosis gene a)-related kinase